MDAALRWLAAATPGSAELLRLMDATAIPGGHCVITAKRPDLAGWAGYGSCPSHSRWYWGAKLLIIGTCDGTITGFSLANPELHGEREQARTTLEHQPANRTTRTGASGASGPAGSSVARRRLARAAACAVDPGSVHRIGRLGVCACGAGCPSGSGGLSSTHRDGPDPDPERVPHGGDPGIHAKTAQAQAQALDLGLRIHHFCAAVDQHAPPGLGLLVIVIGLECGAILPLGRSGLRPVSRAEDHVLAIYDVVHRQDHHLAVRDEADPPYRDGGQQPQALIKRQYLKPCVIGRIP
jgi:hypothetical protein